MTQDNTPTLSVATLQREFDEAFANPVNDLEENRVPHLLLRVGTEAQLYAIALREVLQIARIGKLAAVPTSLGSLLGLIAVRSTVVPVYGIAALLGLEQEPPRWFATHGTERDPVGFGFGQFEGYVEVIPSQLHETRSGTTVSRLIQTTAGTHAVLELSSLVEVIRGQIGAPRADKEK